MEDHEENSKKIHDENKVIILVNWEASKEREILCLQVEDLPSTLTARCVTDIKEKQKVYLPPLISPQNKALVVLRTGRYTAISWSSQTDDIVRKVVNVAFYH